MVSFSSLDIFIIVALRSLISLTFELFHRQFLLSAFFLMNWSYFPVYTFYFTATLDIDFSLPLHLTVFLFTFCDLDWRFYGFLPRQCGALGVKSQKLQLWRCTESPWGGGGFRWSLFLISLSICLPLLLFCQAVRLHYLPANCSAIVKMSRGLNSSTAWFDEVWFLCKVIFWGQGQEGYS